ncbi:MAG: preprotein translocase subunit SecE [Pirellulales bacterium]|nr:preprotein translocase subunit SecE [Pirellulales bacterium]
MPASSFVGEIFHIGLYKPSQGRITRQVTCAVLWIVCLLASLRLYQSLYDQEVWQYAAPFAVLVLGFWASYRIVNYAKFADFLIAVEAEMNKVTWPSKDELIRAAIVVMFTIFFLALSLFFFDIVWQAFFNFIGVTS